VAPRRRCALPGHLRRRLFDRLTDEVEGTVVENESIVNLPDWLDLRIAVEDGGWLDLATVGSWSTASDWTWRAACSPAPPPSSRLKARLGVGGDVFDALHLPTPIARLAVRWMRRRSPATSTSSSRTCPARRSRSGSPERSSTTPSRSRRSLRSPTWTCWPRAGISDDPEQLAARGVGSGVADELPANAA
jgi:hypothetical protein